MASDHAREAATLVLADLCDRRDISGAIEGCDADIRAEIHESLAAIIREFMDRENQQLRDRVAKLIACHELAVEILIETVTHGRATDGHQDRYVAACKLAGVKP